MKLTWVLFLLLCSVARADGPLRSVIIFGNEKTDRKTILDIVDVPPRTLVNQALVVEVESRLVNSGLFKSVAVRKVDYRDGTTDLRVAVREKQLWFVFPIFQAWSGRYSFGAALGESNLLLPSTRSIVGGQWGNKISRVFLATDSKNVWDIGLSTRTVIFGRWDDVPLYQQGRQVSEISVDEFGAEFTPGYQWTNLIRTSLGVGYRYVSYGASSLVPEAGTQGHDVSMQFEFLYDSLKRKDGFVRGDLVKFSYRFAKNQLGTDYAYNTEHMELSHAQPFLRYFNYIVKLEGAIGDRLPFHRHFTLGGNSLRGYAERQLRGDTLVTLKQDMLFRVLRHPKFSVFGDVFHDFGYLYFDALGPSTSSLRNGVGAGLRVTLADIVAPVLGLDAGYGIESKQWQIVLAVGLVAF